MKLLSSKEPEAESKPTYKPPSIPFPESLFSRPRPTPEARVIYMDGNIYPANIN